MLLFIDLLEWLILLEIIRDRSSVRCRVRLLLTVIDSCLKVVSLCCVSVFVCVYLCMYGGRLIVEMMKLTRRVVVVEEK